MVHPGDARLRRMSFVKTAPSADCLATTRGALTLFGPFDTPPLGDLGLTLGAEPGLPVAFRSTVLHGVTPVTAGVRRTMID